MSLLAGSRLGPYEIVSLLGSGGMGEVWRARDTRLGREVAVKVLPASLAEDAQALARFEREARAVAALSHPHIVAIHDIGKEGATAFIVMELLGGETLAARLTRGALPLAEVLTIGTQVAEALAAAHRLAIVHRDLKPANVMLTRSGVKLLDFGLAKRGGGPISATANEGWTHLPTAAGDAPLTAEGSLLGTLHYMSPEQMEGREVDARSDLFAFGAMLFEMVAGRRAFAGHTPASVIAAVLKEEPPPLTDLAPLAPSALERLVRRCLAKLPEERWQSAADVAEALRWIREQPPVKSASTPTPAPRRRPLSWLLPAVVGGLVVAAAVALMATLRPGHGFLMGVTPSTSVAPPTVLVAMPPIGGTFNPEEGPAVLSPDGRSLAFQANRKGEVGRLWVRRLDSLEPVPIPATEGGYDPFWSPDSRSLGFFNDQKLQRIDLAGGPPRALADAPDARGGTWARSGLILFAPRPDRGIFRVPAAGGVAIAVTRPDTAAGEVGHLRPSMLPDDTHFLFFARSTRPQRTGIRAASLDGSVQGWSVPAEAGGIYLDPGYLLFVRQGVLLAQPLRDWRRGPGGSAVQVAPGVAQAQQLASAGFAGAGDVLIYHPTETGSEDHLVWLDRRGKEVDSLEDRGLGRSGNLDLAADGRHLTFQRSDPKTHMLDVWTLDLSGGMQSRLTFDSAAEFGPVWSPDSRRIAYVAEAAGQWRLMVLTPGGGAATQLLAVARRIEVVDWSPDGRFLLFERAGTDNERRSGLWLVGTRVGDVPRPLIDGPFSEESGRFSPDGRWLVYQSNENGQAEIYLQPFPPTGARWQVSDHGGVAPRWGAGGSELFYRADGRQLAVAFSFGAEPRLGTPVQLFAGGSNDYEPATDGRRFLFALPTRGAEAPLVVMLHWAGALGSP